MKSKRVAVVGCGMVAHHFLETMAQEGGEEWEIDVFGNEALPPYDRVHLGNLIEGATAESLFLGTDSLPSSYHFHLDAEVTAIGPEKRNLETCAGFLWPWDHLVLATGARALNLPLENASLPGIVRFRTLADAEAIARSAARRIVVVGGGLLGLEVAWAMSKRGARVTVVECAPSLLPQQLDANAACHVARKLEAMGVEILCGVLVEKYLGKNRVEAVALSHGDVVECDLVILSAGVRPNDELARSAGLRLGPSGGVWIDGLGRTSQPEVWAIGDCAALEGRPLGLVAPGFALARAVAAQLLGKPSHEVRHAALPARLKVPGLDVISFGETATASDVAPLAYEDALSGTYRKLLLEPETKRIRGAIFVGDSQGAERIFSLYQEGKPLAGELRQSLVGGGSPAPETKELADAQVVCSCRNVTKGEVVAAVREHGIRDLAGLKACTRAGTGCGGCVPLLNSLLAAELARAGVAAKKDLCEHFAFSRQELFHLARVHGIRTFDDMLERHGRGLGCEICKPTVGSILASLWNEPILKPEHAHLQDTNDRFLGNVQKDGTYSVVPRIPGGEITPDKLIVIGEVARDFGLYTKITGGQRVDLFGARAEDLPRIWERLVDAGFESGHAYGKSLRTCKSCVGNRWCRYGVGDSVGLAVRLENRYKGLRAPHKIKMAVSGCARECAEAQCKDIGVIATEKGWNLHVCGNGGARPQHAVLLASDLDETMLVRVIDRVLMFYVRTADRLERTATWFQKLEGGVEYLRRVILEDALGIVGELESDMERVLASYQDEWRVAVEEMRDGFAPLVARPRGEGVWEVPDALRVPENAGIEVRLGDESVALFRVKSREGERFFAVGADDPFSRTRTLARGIVGSAGETPKVAAPLYKQTFSLENGRCLEDSGMAIPVYPVQVLEGKVIIKG